MSKPGGRFVAKIGIKIVISYLLMGRVRLYTKYFLIECLILKADSLPVNGFGNKQSNHLIKIFIMKNLNFVLIAFIVISAKEECSETYKFFL